MKAFRDLVAKESEDRRLQATWRRPDAVRPRQHPAPQGRGRRGLRAQGGRRSVGAGEHRTSGFVILKLTERRPALSRSLDEAKLEIQKRLLEELRAKKKKEFVEEARKTVKVEIFEDELAKLDLATARADRPCGPPRWPASMRAPW